MHFLVRTWYEESGAKKSKKKSKERERERGKKIDKKQRSK